MADIPNSYYIAIEHNNKVGIVEAQVICDVNALNKFTDYYNEFDLLFSQLYKSIENINNNCKPPIYLDMLVSSTNSTSYNNFFNTVKEKFNDNNIYYIDLFNINIDTTDSDAMLKRIKPISVELLIFDVLYNLTNM